jgi:hypothetical protein
VANKTRKTTIHRTNNNETFVRDSSKAALKIRTSLRGGLAYKW